MKRFMHVLRDAAAIVPLAFAMTVLAMLIYSSVVRRAAVDWPATVIATVVIALIALVRHEFRTRQLH